MEYEYPTNGRVAIVDDMIEEVLPLIKFLSQKGVAVSYFTGRGSEMPSIPLNVVRLLFLDFKLEGIEFTPEEVDVARALKPVVEGIIGPENGPYILFGWTKHYKYMEALVAELSNKPVLHLNMEKDACLIGNVQQNIEQKLTQEIKKIGHLKTIFDWENLINDSAASTVNRIFSKFQDKDSVESILYCIAKANLEKQIDSAEKEQKIKAAFQCFNLLLFDTADDKLKITAFDCSDDLTQKIAVDDRLKSIINSKLLLGQIIDNKPCPGNVYSEYDEERKKKLIRFIVKRFDWNGSVKSKFSGEADAKGLNGQAKEKYIKEGLKKLIQAVTDRARMVFLEVTPICDYANNCHKYYRIIPGLLLKDSICKDYKLREQGEYFYSSPCFFYDTDSYKLILDFRGFVTIDLAALGNKNPLIKLQKELLFDIQHKAGSHFGRPGVILISD